MSLFKTLKVLLQGPMSHPKSYYRVTCHVKVLLQGPMSHRFGVDFGGFWPILGSAFEVVENAPLLIGGFAL